MSSRPIYFVYQPPGTNQCGQCCVGMLLHLKREEACELVGKKGCTSSRDLRAALESKGWTLGPRINAKKVEPEHGKVYIAIVHWAKDINRTHWVIVNSHGQIIDPAGGDAAVKAWPKTAYLTSLYEVGGSNGDIHA